MPDGILAKLTITPFKDSETIQAGPPAGPPFVAQFNPEAYTVSNEFELAAEDPAHGDVGSEGNFKSIKPRTFSFEFLLDGTGASGDIRDVTGEVQAFKQTIGFSGEIHRPHFLVLNWGPFLATCVLETYSVNYKLFRPDGTPLRALLSATFREHKPNQKKELEKNLNSPDLTHAHQVLGSEHLSLITYRVYKDPRYYIHVAEQNNLDTVRSVSPGQTLLLPPLT